MFRTILTKSLRDYRWAILSWGIGLGVIVYAQYATYAQLYNTPNAAATLLQLGQQFRFFGEPIRLDTPGGYAQFRAMGVVPVLLGIWAVLAGARMLRGDEEHGSLDILLATPQSRLRALAEKAVALAAATGLIAALLGVWILLGMKAAKVNVDVGGAFLAAGNAGLTALVFATLALLLAQFMSRGAAAGWAGGLMALFYVVDGTGRTIEGGETVRRFSPFFYYQLSKPLVPSYGTNWGAVAVLLALCVIGVGLTVPLFLRRDLGRTALADVTWGGRGAAQAHPRSSQQAIAAAARAVSLRGVGIQALRRQGAMIFWWVAALAFVSGYLVLIAKSTEKELQKALGSSPLVQALFSGGNLGTNNGFLSVIIFTFLPVVVSVFAGMIAYRWATDLDNGRLELVLSTPPSRWRVILERYGAVLVAAVGMVLGVWLAIMLFAQASGFTVDAGRVAAASFSMLPLELITASLVFALAGLLPPGAVIGIMSAFLGVSFLAQVLKTLLNLPDWVLRLSIFHQIGNPIVDGLSWEPFVVMLLIALALLAIGGWQFSTRDVDRGAVES